MEGFVIVPPAGEPLPGSFEVKVRVRSSHTNGVLAVIEETLVPKAFVTPHVHRNDVWVYVLNGEIGVLVGDDIATARAGEWASSLATSSTPCGTRASSRRASSKCSRQEAPKHGSRNLRALSEVTATASSAPVDGMASSSCAIAPGPRRFATASGWGDSPLGLAEPSWPRRRCPTGGAEVRRWPDTGSGPTAASRLTRTPRWDSLCLARDVRAGERQALRRESRRRGRSVRCRAGQCQEESLLVDGLQPA